MKSFEKIKTALVAGLFLPALMLILTSLSGDSTLLFEGITNFDVDVAGNVFVQKGNTIGKYDGNRQKQASYTNYSFGNISSFEAADALNFMVYYSESEQIVFLDNMLSVKRSPIDLALLGFPQVSVVCPSYNTGFWLFDNVSHKLIRFNRLLQKSQSTGNLQQITGQVPEPFLMRESGEYVLLADSSKGIFVFDRYGAYLKSIPIHRITEFQMIGDKLNLLRNDTLLSVDMKTSAIDTVPLPFAKVVKFKFSTSKFYYQTSEGKLYTLSL